MLTKTKIALATALVALTGSVALAQEFDPNLANRYPAYADPVGPAGAMRTAPVKLLQGRDVGLTRRKRFHAHIRAAQDDYWNEWRPVWERLEHVRCRGEGVQPRGDRTDRWSGPTRTGRRSGTSPGRGTSGEACPCSRFAELVPCGGVPGGSPGSTRTSSPSGTHAASGLRRPALG